MNYRFLENHTALTSKEYVVTEGWLVCVHTRVTPSFMYLGPNCANWSFQDN